MARRNIPIDREKACPFLLRLFWKEDDSHPIEQFKNIAEIESQEIQLYTWKDANLREIVELVKTGLNKVCRKDTRFTFFTIYQDNQGNWKKKEIGSVVSMKKNKDDFITLEESKFAIGDYLDLKIQF